LPHDSSRRPMAPLDYCPAEPHLGKTAPATRRGQTNRQRINQPSHRQNHHLVSSLAQGKIPAPLFSSPTPLSNKARPPVGPVHPNSVISCEITCQVNQTRSQKTPLHHVQDPGTRHP
jgi:hypothetical protein